MKVNANTSKLAAGTGGSVVVERCQVCDSSNLQPIIFLGYLPPVNRMLPVGERPSEQPTYPAQLLHCSDCELVQLGLVVDPKVLFPPDYPYTSGTTRILRENFAELYDECRTLVPLGPNDLVVDIGANDGTLLSNFKTGGHRVQGIEPALVGNVANDRGIPTIIAFFGRDVADRIVKEQGTATIVTATNVFAHIEDIHEVLDSIVGLLGSQGVFISESHYLFSLIETLQYDTIYHEHLRYYSLRSLKHLLELHGLTVFHAKRIATHGGSIRAYAAKAGTHEVRGTVEAILNDEAERGMGSAAWEAFRQKVLLSKLQLHTLLRDIKSSNGRVYGVGAPSRASTLINYVGLDDGILDCVLEVKGSQKIGKYMPGTLIPVVEESRLFSEQPEYALLLSWHIATELMPKLTQKGFKGRYLIPLPLPRIVAPDAQ